MIITAVKAIRQIIIFHHLEISPGSLSPAFSVGRTSYSVSVADDVTKLIVSADTRDGNANENFRYKSFSRSKYDLHNRYSREWR